MSNSHIITVTSNYNYDKVSDVGPQIIKNYNYEKVSDVGYQVIKNKLCKNNQTVSFPSSYQYLLA